MNDERLMNIIIGAHVSEKATNLADKHRQIVFKVVKNANKTEIKKAVEKLFKVEVVKVNVLNKRGKQRKFGQIDGKRKDWKKAYVALKDGHDIQFTEFE